MELFLAQKRESNAAYKNMAVNRNTNRPFSSFMQQYNKVRNVKEAAAQAAAAAQASAAKVPPVVENTSEEKIKLLETFLFAITMGGNNKAYKDGTLLKLNMPLKDYFTGIHDALKEGTYTVRSKEVKTALTKANQLLTTITGAIYTYVYVNPYNSKNRKMEKGTNVSDMIRIKPPSTVVLKNIEYGNFNKAEVFEKTMDNAV